MEDAKKLQICFQTLADVNRLKIIRFIGEEERSVSEIVQAINLSQPLVSHHLKTLRNREFLEANRKGPFILYKLKDRKLLDALGLFLDIINLTDNENSDKPMFCCPEFWSIQHKKTSKKTKSE